MKRNQEVVVSTELNGKTIELSGKVAAIGRDFVMLTNLKDRFWIRYQAILSANSPPGVPTYEASHQNFIYDNDLKMRLMTNFGETVSRREALIQQFFEESFKTNLERWQEIWVKVVTSEDTYSGKIISVSDQSMVLDTIASNVELDINEISHISSMRLFLRLNLISKRIFKFFAR